jgi:hypothetical protein
VSASPSCDNNPLLAWMGPDPRPIQLARMLRAWSHATLGRGEGEINAVAAGQFAADTAADEVTAVVRDVVGPSS